MLISNVPRLGAEQSEWIAAEVRKKDLDNARITLRRQEIKSLDMSAMKNHFVVEDVSILTDNKVGKNFVFLLLVKSPLGNC